MKKPKLSLIALLVLLPFALFATDRIVVLEIFTATWSENGPGAAMGADDLVEAHPDEVLVVEYHVNVYGDPFDHTDANARKTFYGDNVPGYPAAIFDGVETFLGGSTDESMFPHYDPLYNTRRGVEPGLEIALEKTGESQGTLTATIKNTSDAEITGRVHFTITECNIHYAWQNQTVLHFVERDMLPDASGELITLGPGSTAIRERNFVIAPSWPYYTEDLGNVEFGCFVQDTTSSGLLREILQAAVIPLENPLLEGIKEKPLPISFSLKVPTLVHAHGYIELSLDATCQVSLTLFDATGRLVKTLYAGSLSAGTHLIDIPAGNLPAGAYFVKATAGVHKQVGKLIVLD